MAKFLTTTAAILFITFLYSCNSPNREKLIIGTWLYHHTENGGRATFTAEDSIKENTNAEGLQMEFRNDKTFCFSKSFTKSNGTYTIVDKGKGLQLDMNDTNLPKTKPLSIIELTNSRLKVLSNGGDSITLVFTKEK